MELLLTLMNYLRQVHIMTTRFTIAEEAETQVKKASNGLLNWSVEWVVASKKMACEGFGGGAITIRSV